ncbi:MAG: alpha/beta hydrolase [Sphingomonas bacterium]|nr:alpha/beta hydrolase [Sphingomonas bacterium]
MHLWEAGPADGIPLILLHGFPESSLAWRKVMRPLGERGFRVLAPDMRGCGRSDMPDGIEAYALDRLVEDVIGLADALGLPTFALAGHDWGGIVAWAVAARHPARVRRLTILNAPHADTVADQMRRHPRQLLRSWYVAFFQTPRVPEKMLSAFGFRALRRSLTQTSRPGAFELTDIAAYVEQWAGPGRLTAMLNYYRALRLHTGSLGRIVVPTQILWGMRDRFLGAHLADAAAAMCDDARVVRFRDDTHWLQHEVPRLIVREIAAFASQTATSGP